jgi:hypothetical protein
VTGVDAVGTAAQVIVPLPSNQANGDVGNVVYGLTIALTGVEAAGSTGTVSRGTTSFAITGDSAGGYVGDTVAVYWALINTVQNPNWTPVTDSQTAGWTTITNTQTPNWVEVTTI